MNVLTRDRAHPVQLLLNGQPRRATSEPRQLLSDFLRHELGLTGTHVGCEHGVCGACTVRVDGVAQRACLMLAAESDGHEVFYVVAPDTMVDTPSAELAATWYPGVPVRGDLSGNRSFFDGRKARELLGWSHDAG